MQRQTEQSKTVLYVIALLLLQSLFFTACQKSTTPEETAEKWGSTQSLSVATEWAGVDFSVPADSFVTEDGMRIDLTTYRYRTGIVEALYQQDDYTVVLRRSNVLQGQELAEDDGTYEKEWDVSLDGLSMHCLGDGTYANVAYFDADGDHYSITGHIGNADQGLKPEDFLKLLNR